MKITNTLTKTKITYEMTFLWRKQVELGDDSYDKLYDSLKVLYSLDLITRELWDFIVETDHELFMSEVESVTSC